MSTFIDEIKKIPIVDYAERIGYTPVRKGNKYVSLKEHDSVMIDTEKNAYWQNSEFQMGKKGGSGSVIDFAMNMRGYDLNAALRELATMYGIEGNRSATVSYQTPTYSAPSKEQKRDAGDIELPKAAKDNRAVFAYLTKTRKIKPEIVQSFINRGMLYQDERRNCVFHTDRFGCKRSTGTKRFAIDLKGNDYSECFLIKPAHKSPLNSTIVVTEAVIDAMSVMSYLSDKRDYAGYTYLALTGTNKTQSLFNALDRNPELQTVVLALDNDEAGRKATAELMKQLKERGVACVDFPAKEGKDWNDYVKILAERQAQEQITPELEAEQVQVEQAMGVYEAPKEDDQLKHELEQFESVEISFAAKKFCEQGGDASIVLAAPKDVSLETMYAVTDAALNGNLSLEQAKTIYAAMQFVAEWNQSNYQQQQEIGMDATYRIDAAFLNELPHSLCRFAASGKDNDYLMSVVEDFVQTEEEEFAKDAEQFLTAKKGLDVIKETAPVVSEDVTHGEETNVLLVAVESTSDYEDQSVQFVQKEGADQFRLIQLSDDGTRVTAVNDEVYDSMQAARNSIVGDTMKEVPFDTLCDMAFENHCAAMRQAEEKQNALMQEAQEKSARIEALQEQIEKLSVDVADLVVIRAWSTEVAISVQQMYPDAVYLYDISQDRITSGSLTADEIIANAQKSIADADTVVIDLNRWNQYVEHQMQSMDYIQTPPTITCEWSESYIFEDNKEYSLQEFNDLMEKADLEHKAGHEAGMEHYGDFEDYRAAANDQNAPYAAFVSPYEKTKFTIHIPNIGSYTDRHDIGDGIGSSVTFLSQLHSFERIVPMLEKVIEHQREQSKQLEPEATVNAAPVAVYSDGKPAWYKQVDEIRMNHANEAIVAEIAERHGVETGRDPFADNPLDTVQENLLVVAALSGRSPEELQSISDAARNGVAEIPMAVGENTVTVEAKVKFVDMAKQYASDMQLVAKREPELTHGEEAGKGADAEKVSDAEVTHGEKVDAAPKDGQYLFDQTKAHILAERIRYQEENQVDLSVDQLKALYQKVSEGMAAGQPVYLTETEYALVQDCETWQADRLSKMDSKERIQYELTEGVKGVLTSDGYKNWLETSSKHFAKQYSFTNAMLVYLQKPDASYTMSYEKWKEFGRQVQKGSEGIRIKAPQLAYEKTSGALFKTIKSNLVASLAKNPTEIATYRLGTSPIEFTMGANHMIGMKVNGKEKMVFSSDDQLKQFIQQNILGKVPVGFREVSVFDISQTEIPKELWVKPSQALPGEIIKDENGNAITNKRGEVKIVNSEERQARFKTTFPEAEFDASKGKVSLNPEQIAVLYSSLVAVNADKNIPVYERSKTDDSVLKSGALGYFDRTSSPESPKGYIVIDKELSDAEKLKVLFHETAHADLHGNLEKLAAEMGLETKELGRTMRETQAESVAFAIAQQFGVETDTSSFSYLAAYSKGFELQELQKSMETIHKEVKSLANDLKAELDARGYDMSLQQKESGLMSKDSIAEKTKYYIPFATAEISKAEADAAEIPELLTAHKENHEAVRLIADIKANADARTVDAGIILSSCKSLIEATSREQQETLLKAIEMAMKRINDKNTQYHEISGQLTSLGKNETNLRKEYSKDAVGTLKKMSAQYPQIGKLSEVQLSYIAASRFMSKQANLLKTNPQKFVDIACERAAQLPKIAAKNGTFIEIPRCEQWTKPPVFQAGALCHPKVAEKIVSNAERLIQDLKVQAENNGQFLPATICDVTAYAVVDGELRGVTTSLEIGDGEQAGLMEHLQAVASSSENAKLKAVLKQVQDGAAEKGRYADKIFGNDFQEVKQTQVPEQHTSHGLGMTRDEVQVDISMQREANSRESAQTTSSHDKGDSATSSHDDAGDAPSGH